MSAPVFAVMDGDPEVLGVRQDRLSKDAIDLLAYFFTLDIYDGAEVRIAGDQCRHICYADGDHDQGTCTFHAHAFDRSERYFSHWNDPEFAVVFREYTDRHGNAERGRQIADLKELKDAKQQGF